MPKTQARTTREALLDKKLAPATQDELRAQIDAYLSGRLDNVLRTKLNELTGGVRSLDIGTHDLPLYGKPRSHVVKPVPGPLVGSASAFSDTTTQLVASPVKYSAVRIGYMHTGGNGATVGTIGLVAATDDVGNRDFTNLTAENFKKVVTPKNGGTSYNSVQTNGTPGWRTLTWAGASAKAMPDAGAGKTSITWSDLIQVEGTADANGMYPLLVRLYHGTGPYTRIAGLTGMQTAAQYATDVLGNYCLSISRSGDNVTTPANWSDANSTFTAGGLPILVEFFSADDVATLMLVGDSRFGVSTELSASKQYLSVEAMLGNSFKAAGKRGVVIGCGLSGQASSVFEPLAASIVSAGVKPTAAAFMAWSVNDGSPTTALTAIAKYRMLEFISLCGDYGVRPIIVTAFPTAGGFTAPQLAALADIKSLALSMTEDVIDPLALYGDTSGAWANSWNTDGNHLTQVGYADFVSRLAAIF